MNEDFAILMVMFGISMTANLFLLVNAFQSARRARRLERMLMPGQPAADSRVDRLEGALEAVEERMDQLVRGQEFLSKLVSERRHAIAAREREVTPH